MSFTRRARPAPDRKAQLAQIHIAKAQLALNDETYRAMLWAIARVHSAKDLDLAGRMRVLEHLRASGFKPKPPKAKAPIVDDHQTRKILVLWSELEAAGALRDASESALNAFCKRVTGVDNIEWVGMRQASNLIEALKAWLARNQRQAETANAE